MIKNNAAKNWFMLPKIVGTKKIMIKNTVGTIKQKKFLDLKDK